MTLSLRISRSGLALIKSFEGYRERATRLPDGRWVIGHGHVKSAREGVRVSPEDAEALLVYDLKPIEHALEDLLFSPLNQNQHDAIVSFVFNISLGLFRDSEVLHRLNTGDHLGAANALEAWRKARINGHVCVVDALVRRRAIEKALFLEHPDGRATAATPLVAPQMDRGLLERTVGKNENATSGSKSDDDVAGMNSAIERLLATGSVNPESSGNTVDIDTLLRRKDAAGTPSTVSPRLGNDNSRDTSGVHFIGENDAQDFSKTSTVSVEDTVETTPADPLEDKEIIFIGETDEDVFSAIGAEVDEALSANENATKSTQDISEDDTETTHERIRSVALASEKVERLVANDRYAVEPGVDTEDRNSRTNEFDILSDDDAIIGSLTIDPETEESGAQNETPEEVILSLLSKSADEADKAETPSVKTPQEAADAVAKRLDSIFEPELLTLTDVVTDKFPDDDDASLSTQDAWKLSEGLTQDDDKYASFSEAEIVKKSQPKFETKRIDRREIKSEPSDGYGFAAQSIPKDPKFDSINDDALFDVPHNADNEDVSRADGRLWIGVMFASVAVIVLGVLDFYRKAQPGKIVNQSDIAFGPLMIAIGGLIFLMAAYFLVSRRGK